MVTQRRSRRARSNGLADLHPLIRLWVLRLLVPLGGGDRGAPRCRDFHANGPVSESVLRSLVAPGSQRLDHGQLCAALRRQYAQAERTLCSARPPEGLAANIDRLAELVGLSELDRRILEFAVLINTETILDDMADWLGHITTLKFFDCLAVLLDAPAAEIRAALSPRATLAQSGLLTIDRNGESPMRGKFDLMSETFADLIGEPGVTPESLLKETVRIAPAARLSLADFGHLEGFLGLLVPFLKVSLEAGRKGVNIFLHGRPGTGKSELSRTLAGELSCELFEVASANFEGEPVRGHHRLRAYQMAQCLFAQRPSLIVFDEVEDIFDDGFSPFGRTSTAATRKANVNRTLEENPVPTIWISNSIGSLDPAFIRRFDMVVEVPVPPRRQRQRIIAEACGGLIDTSVVARLAGSEDLAPAVVTRAASVARAISTELGKGEAGGVVELLANATLEAQGHKPVRRNDPAALPQTYDPAFINADADLEAIARGLAQTQSGRLCLYGPPGTGKTAYGRWLAARLDRPLLVRRASDLLSMFVGETERNIADCFRRAERENAILLIDEIDSFLRDRRGADHGWEISQVNEMLTGIESFPGIFIGTTNLFEGLDPAALRRFDVKARFDFLDAGQAWKLLSRHCAALGLGRPPARLKACIRQLGQLTPGDFAAAARRHRFSPFASPEALLQALEEECAVKTGGRSSIGFI